MMSEFITKQRQQFRKYYQPTRIVLGILPAPNSSGLNVITLCFSMYCSYKPPMMAFAVQRPALSYELLQYAEQCVLAVPGESLAEETLYCGTESGRQVDKITECNLPLVKSLTVNIPGIKTAIANIELGILNKVETGDHLTVVALVKRFSVNPLTWERNLLSVGPDHDGYTLLKQKGIHRIAVITKG